MSDWIDFSPTLDRSSKARFRTAVQAVLSEGTDRARHLVDARAPDVRAAVLLLCDLVDHGWELRKGPEDAKRKRVQIRRSISSTPADETRTIVRKQHLRARDEQLAKETVQKFVRSMERNRAYQGAFVSIFSLMRDGRELAGILRQVRDVPESQRSAELGRVVQPYLQFVSEQACPHTGLALGDIWRYFRHTWASHHASTPGRSMAFIVRDAAARFHPVIGIGALGSAVVQSTVRDKWLGWIPEEVVESLRQRPTKSDAIWLCAMLQEFLDGLYIEDFLEDGLIKPADLQRPSSRVVARLNDEATRSKKQHQLNYEPSDHRRGKSNGNEPRWLKQARTDLFRSKRAELLAMLLEARMTMNHAFGAQPDADGLRAILGTGAGRKVVARLIHRKKAENVGVNIAEITVCGAVAPYSHVIGGKLVAMLACSPEIVAAYRDRYQHASSIIASSMAGRDIVRKPHLVALSTTSLYGVVPNQYTRLSVPTHVLGQDGEDRVRFEELGVTLGYGTFHLTSSTREALWQLVQQKESRAAVNWVFGEGVNPRLRGLRDGMDALGLPSDEILKHGSSKVVYGVLLARNATDILLGKRKRPEYILAPEDPQQATQAIASYWASRWLAPRITRDDILDRVAIDTLVYPVKHGARAVLPSDETADAPQHELFE